MFIITSISKNIRALSETNGSVEFHNKLFETDDCVITWQDDPTEAELEAQKIQNEIDDKEAQEKEKLIQDKIREQAISALKIEGKLDADCKLVK